MSDRLLTSLRRACVFTAVIAATTVCACKRSEPPPVPFTKPQHDAMDRARGVGETMQKGVDAEGKKADEEGR